MTFVEDLKKTSDDNERLASILKHFGCDSGTIHKLGDDGMLHPKAEGPGMAAVHDKIQTIPVGKGMAGLAIQRNAPVTSCNLQEDTSGDIRPGAKEIAMETGLHGSIVVPIRDAEDKAIGALGVASKTDRTFTEAEITELLECGKAIA